MVDSLTPANEPDSTPVYEHWGHGPGGTAPHSAVLTDEELAALAQLAKYFPEERIPAGRVRPLIAALHTARKRIQHLEDDVRYWQEVAKSK